MRTKCPVLHAKMACALLGHIHLHGQMDVIELYISHTQVNPQADCIGRAMQLLLRSKPLLMLLLLLKLKYQSALGAAMFRV